MLQRTLARCTRAANATPSFRALPKATPISSTASPFFKVQTYAPRITPRWYSEATEASKEPVEGQKDAAVQSEESNAQVDALKKQLEDKKKESADFKDKYLRSVADFRNLQERTKRDVSNASNFAITKFAKDLIESIDNLDRALGAVPSESIVEATDGESAAQRDLRNLHSGLRMTETILMSTLKKHGLERMDPVEGDKFDPNKHEAVAQLPQPGKEDGTVFFTQQKGFILNGRVIRAPKVGVVKNS